MLLLDVLVRNVIFPIRKAGKGRMCCLQLGLFTTTSLDTCCTRGEMMVSVNFSSKSLLPMAAPRSLFSSVMICTLVPLNSLFCCRFHHYQPQFAGLRMVISPWFVSVQLVPPTSYFFQRSSTCCVICEPDLLGSCWL